MALPSRDALFPDAGRFTPGSALLDVGRGLARTWTVGPCPFLKESGFACEADYKRAAMAAGRVMQHAQIGYRDPAKSRRAYEEIWSACAAAGVRVDRYGLCLDWSMAVPRDRRAAGLRGTGMILEGVEDFVALAGSAPVAPHFGDFVLGFPAALENTQAALAAGSTAIGNLGQYFTFRVPGFDDDVAATEATVQALGLIAAQPVAVLVHSNIDDGYAAQFTDCASCLGFILIERDLVTRLVGAPIGHCYGHHFSDPTTRLAFQRALARIDATPGTIVYGNTTSYRGGPAANFAGLASYLLVDILAQMHAPTGHAVNAVPVTENQRIPEIEEIIDAQLFAGRLIEHAAGHVPILALGAADAMADRLVEAGRRFAQAVTAGLDEAGVDTSDAFEMLLALRRIGARRLEAEFGPGPSDPAAPSGRRAVVPAAIVGEIAELARHALARTAAADRDVVAGAGLRVLVATSDVHEHGKLLIEEMLRALGVAVLDGGVSTEPERLAERAEALRPDAVALSTYNGIALTYHRALAEGLALAGLTIPVLVGGRLNQIPDGSNTSLPVDVGDDLAKAGAVVCRDAADLVPILARLSSGRSSRRPQ